MKMNVAIRFFHQLHELKETFKISFNLKRGLLFRPFHKRWKIIVSIFSEVFDIILRVRIKSLPDDAIEYLQDK